MEAKAQINDCIWLTTDVGARTHRGPLSGAKRTSRTASPMSDDDPNRTLRVLISGYAAYAQEREKVRGRSIPLGDIQCNGRFGMWVQNAEILVKPLNDLSRRNWRIASNTTTLF